MSSRQWKLLLAVSGESTSKPYRQSLCKPRGLKGRFGSAGPATGFLVANMSIKLLGLLGQVRNLIRA